MKRWYTLVLAGLLTLSLAGCVSQTDGGSSQQPQQSNGSAAETVSSSGQEDPWGLTLSVKDVTPTGLTLVITQQGGSPTGELQYGSEFILEAQQDGAWQPVSDILDGSFAWDGMAYLVTMNGQTEETVDWDWLFGTLSPGHYRLSKEFLDFRDTGDYDTQVYEAEFDIP